MKAKHPYVGIGLYSIPEAARIIGVPAQKLNRWAAGYTFRSGEESRSTEPLFQRVHAELVSQRILTFADLIELHLVSLFRKAGVSLQTIRTTAKWASHQFKTNHPFAVKRFHTDGKRLFAEMEHSVDGAEPRRFYQELPVCQLVFDTVAEAFFQELDYKDEEVGRFWPMGKDHGVVLDPERSFGKPIDSESGVPTFALYQMVRAGESVESVARWYNVRPEAVTAAFEYEMSLAA